MSTPIHDYLWVQGDDLVVAFLYKEGPLGSEVPVDLTDYTVRMDITNPDDDDAVVFTFNTAEQTDPDEIVVNADATDGLVKITVPRSLTLPPSGAVYVLMESNPSILVYNYDIFLRNPDDKQKKLFRGTITIEPSYTLWS